MTSSKHSNDKFSKSTKENNKTIEALLKQVRKLLTLMPLSRVLLILSGEGCCLVLFYSAKRGKDGSSVFHLIYPGMPLAGLLYGAQSYPCT